MTLTDREKFIHHFITLTTVKVLLAKLSEGDSKSDVYSSLNKDIDDMSFIIKKIQETRCRKLSDDEIKGIVDDLMEEALLGGNIINEGLR